MVINELAIDPKYQIQKILKVLEESYGVSLDLNTSISDIQETYSQCSSIRNQIISESAFNSYHSNSEYQKCILIQEAIRLFLSEVAPKRLRRRNKK